MIALAGITKRFAGVRALDDVSLDVAAGTCHALMGENGAGKSTLARIAAGIHRPDAGTVAIDGVPRAFRSPADALSAGVAMVHQELAFCPDLSVAENLALGRWPRRRWGRIDRRAMHRRAEALLARVGTFLDVRQPMRALSVAQEQLVQIAHALGTGARVLFLDEPTSALSEGEAEGLFSLVESLRAGGLALVYVSHRIPEVLRLCDRATVLRDGRVAGVLERHELDGSSLVRLMVGRDVGPVVARHVERAPGDVVLEVSGLSTPAGVDGIGLEVRAGEIVGLAGLVGAGRSALLAAIFGLDVRARGTVSIGGRRLPPHAPRAAIAAGVGFVPEDRKRQGLVLGMGAVANQSLASLAELRRGPLLDRAAELRAAVAALAAVDLRAASLHAPVDRLSGGNQQKVVLARWLGRSCRLLLVDEPTRGVDVAAKAAIHGLVDDLAARGVAVLLVSSELPELMALSSRVLVLRGGRLVAEHARAGLTEHALLEDMAGVG